MNRTSQNSQCDVDHVTAWRRGSLGSDVLFIRAHYESRCFQRHIHDWFVIGLNVGGAHRSYTRGQEITIPTGQISLINPGDVHSGLRASRDPWSFRAFHVSSEFMRMAAGRSGGEVDFAVGVVNDPSIFARLLRTHQLAEEGASPTRVEDNLMGALGRLANRYAPRDARPSGAGRRRGDIDRAREYIEARCPGRLTLDEMAEVAKLSRFYFLRRFKQEVGMTPYAYLADLRVREAARRLDSGEPIGRVAFAAGFADQSHLTRSFKRTLGITPGQFLRQEPPSHARSLVLHARSHTAPS